MIFLKTNVIPRQQHHLDVVFKAMFKDIISTGWSLFMTMFKATISTISDTRRFLNLTKMDYRVIVYTLSKLYPKLILSYMNSLTKSNCNIIVKNCKTDLWNFQAIERNNIIQPYFQVMEIAFLHSVGWDDNSEDDYGIIE